MPSPVLADATTTCCPLSTGRFSDHDAARYALLFKVLAEPVRLQILSHLAGEGCGPTTVGELADILDLSQPTVSHHLKKLTDGGLLSRHQQGRSVFHTVRPEVFRELRGVLDIG